MTPAADGADAETLALLQARMSSTRLPGKALRPMNGVPVLELLVDRVGDSWDGGRLVVATSDQLVALAPADRQSLPAGPDDPIAAWCERRGVACVRGALEDVLARFVAALERYRPDVVVRLTGDNPLVDGRAVAAGVEAFRRRCGDGQATGVSNHLEDRTDPYGYCVEVVRPGALRELLASDPSPEDREHVTLGLRRRGRLESYGILPGDRRSLRWTVDTGEDFDYVESLFVELGPACTAEEAVRWSHGTPHPSAGGG